MRLALALVLLVGLAAPASADSCQKSLDYIMRNLSGELPQPGAAYQILLQTCLQTLLLSNVKDAYILKDGGIAAVARNPGVFATAQTLAAFCRKFPRATLRIVTPREARRGLTTGRAVLMASDASQSCKKIVGDE